MKSCWDKTSETLPPENISIFVVCDENVRQNRKQIKGRRRGSLFYRTGYLSAHNMLTFPIWRLDNSSKKNL